MWHLIAVVFYQPFLNILVGSYWLLGQTPIGYDMGIAVIMLTIVIRLLLLPLTWASSESEAERREIAEEVKRLKMEHAHQPIQQRAEIQKVLRSNKRVLLAEATMFLIQLGISLILWRIFAEGLTGKDLHFLYSWMPHPPTPYNLTFLNTYDLTHPDWHLNVVQTILIFVLETIGIITSSYLVSREEVVRLQVILPLMSFFIFAFLPAGKKLFVITTLSFSLIIVIGRIIWRTIAPFFPPPEPDEPEEDASEAAVEVAHSAH